MLPENPLVGQVSQSARDHRSNRTYVESVGKGGGKDKRGRGWMATMERRTWDLYIRAAESRGGEVISVPVAD
jgi:hypothetical protein